MIRSRSISFFSHQSPVLRGAEVTERLAVAGQVVELATFHRALDLEIHPPRLVLDPGGGGLRPVRGSLSCSLSGLLLTSSSLQRVEDSAARERA